VASTLEGGLLSQSLRYLAASVAALLGDLIVYAILLRAELVPATAGAVGYGSGLVLHYVLSAEWVFPDPARHRRPVPTFVAFAATGLLGLGLTTAVIGTLTDLDLCGVYAAKAIAVVVSYVAVFALRRVYVFAPRTA
jgi:putative flippase GtrA